MYCKLTRQPDNNSILYPFSTYKILYNIKRYYSIPTKLQHLEEEVKTPFLSHLLPVLLAYDQWLKHAFLLLTSPFKNQDLF